MHRVRAVVPILLLIIITGCAAPSPPLHQVTTPVAAPTPDIAANTILIRFKTLDCVCHLGNVEFALLQLPGVESVDWDIDHNSATLIFMDDRRPADPSIHDAIADFGVEIASIVRPATLR